VDTQKCLFCRIVAREEPAYIIREDDKYIAFLDAFPLVEGQTVVMPKKHFSGHAFDMPTDELKELMAFTQLVSKQLNLGLGAERCMHVTQGYAIDHAHTKLFPVKEVKEKVVDGKTYSELIGLLKSKWYSGFIISMSGKERESDEKLKELAARIMAKAT
jgi:diadenosine tetraphosphate (Ap4A) HIT family hydrolase